MLMKRQQVSEELRWNAMAEAASQAFENRLVNKNTSERGLKKGKSSATLEC
jgi:hypothetical protein